MNDGPGLDDWIGRSFTGHDIALASPLATFDALLDRAPMKATLAPPLAHWLYFLPVARQSELGADGHPRLGTTLPDLGLPRRMWAGSRVRFHQPIEIGSPIMRRTTIRSLEMKQGSSGPLGIVTLGHEVSARDVLLVSEEQTLIYREASSPAAAPERRTTGLPEQKEEAEILVRKRFDPVELFRFSALTGNTHRIHYDADYARTVEGYAGLVVHGPFQAMVLMDLFRRHNLGAAITGFEFRAVAPLFAGDDARIYNEAANPATLRIQPVGRGVSMMATIYSG